MKIFLSLLSKYIRQFKHYIKFWYNYLDNKKHWFSFCKNIKCKNIFIIYKIYYFFIIFIETIKF